MQKIDKFFVRQQIARVAGGGESMQSDLKAAGLAI